ncbi:MAG: hypothetical protein ACLVJ6_09675 [Merdibacter sp.]
MHIDEVNTSDAADVDVEIPAFKRRKRMHGPFVMDDETKEKIERT